MSNIPELYEHQERVATKLSTDTDELYLNHGLGSGKTRSVIESIRRIFNSDKRMKRTLILCPASVPHNWRKEIIKFSKIADERIFVIPQTDRKNKVREAIHAGKTILIMNYEALLAKEIQEMLLEWEPQILVCDESHKLKTPNSARSKIVAKIALKTEKRILLSGTQILKNLMDIYSQFKVLDNGKTFGTNFWTFRARYFVDENAAWAGKAKHFPKWIPRPDAEPELMRLINRKADVITSEECLKLPPRIEMVEDIIMSKEQEAAYKSMKDAFVAFVNDNTDNPALATVAPVKAIRLNQICAGHVTLDDGTTHFFKSNPKLDRLFEILEEITGEHKVIVWTTFRADIKLISERAKEEGYKFVTLTGDQNALQKQEALDAFETDPTVRIMLANKKAGGTGCNMVQASYDIGYSMDHNLGDHLQSRARNFRGGSEIHSRITSIFLCVKDSIEEIIKESLDKKENIGKMVIEWAKNNK